MPSRRLILNLRMLGLRTTLGGKRDWKDKQRRHKVDVVKMRTRIGEHSCRSARVGPAPDFEIILQVQWMFSSTASLCAKAVTLVRAVIVTRSLRVFALSCGALFALATPNVAQTIWNADQGTAWTPTVRERFYHLDQGSRLIPFAWLQALELTDGTPFLADRLARYGFLSEGDGNGEAVGVSLAATPQGIIAGLTCSACHTRDIEVGNQTVRVEGAPAFIDFYRLLIDLDDSVRRVLSDENRFQRFADRAASSSSHSSRNLRTDLDLWSQRFHVYVSALPPQSWGPGRLDAFGLIFNQLGALDVGTGRAQLIPQNIRIADAPVRYPFLWNSPFQDKTDWPGFADNGNDRAALARNISEALGVFATFHPEPSSKGASLNRDYLANNSEDLPALEELEAMVVDLKPPIWPWPIDKALAGKGKAIFERATKSGGCAECHGARPGAYRGPRPTFATPVVDVGTDTRMWANLGRTVNTGTMAGAAVPGEAPLLATDTAAHLLKTAVVGILLQASQRSTRQEAATKPYLDTSAHETKVAADPRFTNAYEARVLSGIWAAAPYLHNGSIPTLKDLLQPAALRPRSFAIGRRFDVIDVGLAKSQPASAFIFRASGCEANGSGNSNCGHEYGTHLTSDEKAALLEYLKTL